MLLSDKVFDNFLYPVHSLRQARVDIVEVFSLLVAEALELLCVLADLIKLELIQAEVYIRFNVVCLLLDDLCT